MQIQKQTKLFAFKLAEKQVKEVKPAAPWKVRDGVSVASCTGPDARGDKYPLGYDNGILC